jgi:hypothetical protein
VASDRLGHASTPWRAAAEAAAAGHGSASAEAAAACHGSAPMKSMEWTGSFAMAPLQESSFLVLSGQSHDYCLFKSLLCRSSYSNL